MFGWHRLTLMCVLALTASTVSAMPVIFDNDAAIDDAMALLVLANANKVDIKAVTITGTGEAHAEPGARNMAALLNALHMPDVPVAYGRATPLSVAGQPFPDQLRVSSDQLLVGKHIKANPHATITNDAVGLIKDTVASSHEKVTILATGPLTNIAEFVTKYPEYRQKIARIVIMGGAVNVPGNALAIPPRRNNLVSECNFYADPESVRQVFAAGIPITLVALDATNQVGMTRSFLNGLKQRDKTFRYLSHQLLQDKIKLVGEDIFYREFFLWDPLAAMVLVDPAIAKSKTIPLIVDEKNGQVRPARRHEKAFANVDVVIKVYSPEKVRQTYASSI